MASTSPSPSPHPSDTEASTLPLPLSASVLLENLPKPTAAALATAGALPQAKVTIKLTALPGAPELKSPRFKCSSSNTFSTIVTFVRKKLGVKVGESVFCYVNSTFAPGLDEGVGGLWACFKTGEELVVSYGVTPAFG
nr:hypothetical protein B0A51_08524 [Rachicladosporium sp. CCFEE 5018]